MQVDLPALERPTKAISGTSIRGKCFNSGAVVRNLAVCNQPMAIFGLIGFGPAAGFGSTLEAAGSTVAGAVGGVVDAVMMGRSLEVGRQRGAGVGRVGLGRRRVVAAISQKARSGLKPL